MEGNRKLTLLEPIDSRVDSELLWDGEALAWDADAALDWHGKDVYCQSATEYAEHVVYAILKRQTGRDENLRDVVVDERERTWEMRYRKKLLGVNRNWKVRDENNREWNVLAVNDIGMRPKRYFEIVARDTNAG